jgi:hypothetical protein
MRRFIKLILIFHLAFFFHSQNVISLENANKIISIKLGTAKDYIIDSLENLNCKCLPNTGRLLLDAALLHLPDSSIVLSIKNEIKLGFTDIKLQKKPINILYNKKLNADTKKLGNGFIKEYDILRIRVNDTTKFQLTDYEELEVPDSKRKKLFAYFNIGLGRMTFKDYLIHYCIRSELGVIVKKNTFSIRTSGMSIQGLSGFMGYQEYGMLFGRNINLKSSMVAISTGISYNEIRELYVNIVHDNYVFESKKFSLIGLPLQIGFSFAPQKFLSFSIGAFANISKQIYNKPFFNSTPRYIKPSFYGLFLGLRFGRLKSISH